MNKIDKSQIRLGFDWREFESGKATGIARILSGVVRYLLQSGQPWEVILFGNQNTEWLAFIPEKSKRVIPEKFTITWDQVLLPKSLRLAHCELFVSPYFKAPLFSPCPVILIVNDFIPKSFYYRLLLKWNIKRARGIICISGEVSNKLAQFVPKAVHKTIVVPLGVSNQFKPGPVNREFLHRQFGIDGKYLLYVGNANPHKNVPALLRSMKLLSHQRLVLCGIDLEENPQLSHIVQKENVKARVSFIKRVSDEALLQLYRGTELFIFPSLEEGFGLPPLEAMASGAPVLASRIPITEEVLGKAAYFVDAEKPDEIAHGVQKILEDSKLRDNLKQKGKARAAFFTEYEMASTFADFLKSIYKETSRG